MADLTYGQLRDALQAAIAATIPDSDDSYHWIYVCDFSDTFVVYCDEDEYLQDDYTLDGEDITLAGNPQPVKAVTTYEPLGAGRQGLEVRSVSGVRARTPSGGWQEMLATNPDMVARMFRERLGSLSRDAMSPELVYTPQGGHGYYRDLLAHAGKITSPGATERLTRHAEQMERAAKIRDERAKRSIAGFEYREPNTNDGTGGYFSPPIWENQLFATANRPRRVLADLMPRFALPRGVSQVNLPILSTGTIVQPTQGGTAVPSQDIADSAGTSAVVPLAGMADVSLQLLEMSPAGAHTDWAIFMDLSEAYDANLEAGLISGVDGTSGTLLGITQVSGAINVTFTGSTGNTMYPYFGRTMAQVGDARDLPPQCWLFRTARWAWLQTSEDTATLPFGIYSQYFLGNTDDTPDPIGGLLGLPVFLDDALPANLSGVPGSFTTGGTQDLVIAARPTDMILFEGEPQTMVSREPLSGSLGARIEMHCYAAAITDRRPAGIGILGGSGFQVASGF